MKLSNATYDTLKWVAQIFLPALATFYIAVAPFWGFPKQEEVAGTIMAIDLFLGVLLGASHSAYKSDPDRFDGEALIKDLGDTKGLRLVFDGTIEELAEKKELVFKVDTNPPGMDDYGVDPPE